MSTLVGRFTGSVAGSRFRQNVAVLGGGTAISQGLLVVAAPVLTRLYSPQDMGLMGLYLAYVGFVTVAVSLRYDAAIVSARDRSEAAHLVVISVLLIVPTSMCFAAFLYGMIRLKLLGFGNLPAYTVLLALPFTLLVGVFGALRYWFIREETLGVVSKALVAQSGARSFFQVAFGAFRIGWVGLVGGDLLSRATSVWRMVRIGWPAVLPEVFPWNRGKAVAALRAHRQFPLFSLPSSIVDTLALSLPLPLIADLYGPSSAGHFSLVLRVLSLPLALVGTSVADAFHGRLAAYARDEPSRGTAFFHRTARVLFLIGSGPTILLVIFGETLFRLVFGQQWAVAGQLATVVAPWTLTQLVVSPLSRVVYVLDGLKLKLAYDLVSLGATFGAILIGHSRGLSLLDTVLLLSSANILANLLYFLLLAHIVGRKR